ncbi:hypothetical protein HanRHA438_Chr11g0525701 [Helianthus annuus]|uniref:Uncharacterized protein n=1 Tax=Helianthus annuus TaxID=4232 RepID=A0A9K3HSN6_HELAN|nr:hypothetical protein HanXRQr2_Chr11g0513681 [Helianthus annuus]KAJ0872600.1 hypothetical protein HanRHA438_Chr11g0525701 [Helianthus annuus]KAJ0876984.1 hypothetical protein HanPSC8_Chr11g0494941 [Helianthus annuus]
MSEMWRKGKSLLLTICLQEDMVVWGKSKEQEHKDPSIFMDEHTTPENQILGEESETNCNDQVIAIKTSDEICDEHDEIQPANV